MCGARGRLKHVKKEESSPMQEIRLPMKYYDETGKNQGLTNQRIDICFECFKALESALSTHYYMSYCAYVGVEIKRHPTEKGGGEQ